MDDYKCMLCGWVYESKYGDPDMGISKGTPFEKIPSDWICPVCGARKDKFERIQ